MPRYDYLCDANGQQIEVVHSLSRKLTTWGEICELAGCPLGDTPADSPVRRVITTAPMTATPKTNSELRDLGFTKLVRRDDGVYENMTRSGSEKRYVRSEDSSSMPHLHKKISD